MMVIAVCGMVGLQFASLETATVVCMNAGEAPHCASSLTPDCVTRLIRPSERRDLRVGSSRPLTESMTARWMRGGVGVADENDHEARLAVDRKLWSRVEEDGFTGRRWNDLIDSMVGTALTQMCCDLRTKRIFQYFTKR